MSSPQDTFSPNMTLGSSVSCATEPTRPGGEQTPPGQVRLLDLVLMVARHKRTVLRVATAAAVASLLVVLSMPNRYRATARILPPQPNQSTASLMMGQMGLLAGYSARDWPLRKPEDTYLGMLESRSVADALIDRFQLLQVYRVADMSRARKKLEGATDILADRNGIIAISVEDPDPIRAAALANGYVDQLYKLNQTLAVSEAAHRRLFFAQELKQAKDDLAAAEVAMKEVGENTGVIALESQAKVIVERVGSLRGLIAAKEVQLKAMRGFATEDNPDLILLQDELTGLRTELAKMENSAPRRKGDVMVPTSAVPQAAVEYVRRVRNVKYYETLFDIVAKQFEAAKMDEAKSASLIQVVDHGVVPDRKSWPPRTFLVLAATALATVGAALFAILTETVRQARSKPANAARLELLRQHLQYEFGFLRRLRTARVQAK